MPIQPCRFAVFARLGWLLFAVKKGKDAAKLTLKSRSGKPKRRSLGDTARNRTDSSNTRQPP